MWYVFRRNLLNLIASLVLCLVPDWSRLWNCGAAVLFTSTVRTQVGPWFLAYLCALRSTKMLIMTSSPLLDAESRAAQIDGYATALVRRSFETGVSNTRSFSPDSGP
jgi:hypothetical protein